MIFYAHSRKWSGNLPAQSTEATQSAITAHRLRQISFTDNNVQTHIDEVRPSLNHRPTELGKQVCYVGEERRMRFQVRLNGQTYGAMPCARRMDIEGTGWLLLELGSAAKLPKLRTLTNAGRHRHIYVAVAILDGHVGTPPCKIAAARPIQGLIRRNLRITRIVGRLLPSAVA